MKSRVILSAVFMVFALLTFITGEARSETGIKAHCHHNSTVIEQLVWLVNTPMYSCDSAATWLLQENDLPGEGAIHCVQSDDVLARGN
jgi:hypothetical protein